MWVSNQTLSRFHEAYYEGPYRGRLTSRGDPPNISPPKSRVKLNWVSLVDMLPISRGHIERVKPTRVPRSRGPPLDTTSKTKLTPCLSMYVSISGLPRSPPQDYTYIISQVNSPLRGAKTAAAKSTRKMQCGYEYEPPRAPTPRVSPRPQGRGT